MIKTKLSKEEQKIESEIDQYVDVGKKEFEEMASALKARKKDAVLNIRINSEDLKHLKQKAKKLGVRYQTFISEVLHKVAES